MDTEHRYLIRLVRQRLTEGEAARLYVHDREIRERYGYAACHLCQGQFTVELQCYGLDGNVLTAAFEERRQAIMTALQQPLGSWRDDLACEREYESDYPPDLTDASASWQCRGCRDS